jgi:hypothetical protein
MNLRSWTFVFLLLLTAWLILYAFSEYGARELWFQTGWE